MMSANSWARNITKLDEGVFRTINGNADELIAVGRIIKAGFSCSRVDITNARYDAVVEVAGGKLLRIQIRGIGNKDGAVSFLGGGRSGQQFDRQSQSRIYKYTKTDCDIFLVIDGSNGDCYIIPIEDLENFRDSKALSKLQNYKENWRVLKNYES